jgi:hypothetical protein
MLRLNNATIYRPGIDSFGHILRLEFAVEQTVY